MSEPVRLAFIGDVMLGRGVNEEILEYTSQGQTALTSEFFWGDVLPVLQETDAVIANLECAITQHLQRCRRTIKMFYFRADPPAIDVLRAANIQCVSLANNHILDFDDQGLLDTLHYLDAAGIAHAGAGRNWHEAIAPAVLKVRNLKIGMIALTDNEPSFKADSTRPGVYYLPIRAALSDTESDGLTAIQNVVAELRQAGISFVILSAHWGPNMVVSPPRHFRHFAHAVLDCGVDLFYGHSAHLFQAVEHYHRGLILYDTGDFLDDYAVDRALRNDWSFVFVVTVDASGVQHLQLIPVRLHYARVELAQAEEFVSICDRMKYLCQEFNTRLLQTATGLELKLR